MTDSQNEHGRAKEHFLIITTINSARSPNIMSTIVLDIKSIGDALTKEVLHSTDPEASKCIDLLSTLTQMVNTNKITIAILEETMIGKTLTKSVKSFRRLKRNSDEDWEQCIKVADELVTTLKSAAEEQRLKLKMENTVAAKAESMEEGLPKSSAAYRMRLVQGKKEMYKDPPALPPDAIIIEKEYVEEPRRNAQTGELTFVPGKDSTPEMIDYLSEFHPNRTPEDILRSGSFGGTYFRSILSAVTNKKYNASDVLKDTVKPEWIKGLKTSMLTSQTYDATINKFKVKCGGSLGMWESSGWIADSDPYGWFQWYCRFYQGRRCSDDARQISRWLKSAGPKGRFRSQLCNKILAAGGVAKIDDVKISPVIRQTLLHWGIEITPSILSKHGKRMKR